MVLLVTNNGKHYAGVIGRGPTQQLDHVRKSRWRASTSASQHFSTKAGFKLESFSKWVRTNRWLRASADRVNVWSLLYILRDLNHYWNVKWTIKRSLHHCI